jgi:hypothetical protein
MVLGHCIGAIRIQPPGQAPASTDGARRAVRTDELTRERAAWCTDNDKMTSVRHARPIGGEHLRALRSGSIGVNKSLSVCGSSS